MGLTAFIKNRVTLVEGGVVHLCHRSTSLSDSSGCLSDGPASPNHKLYKILKHWRMISHVEETYFWLVNIQFDRHRKLWLRARGLLGGWIHCWIEMGHVACQIRVVDLPNSPIGITRQKKLVACPAEFNFITLNHVERVSTSQYWKWLGLETYTSSANPVSLDQRTSSIAREPLQKRIQTQGSARKEEAALDIYVSFGHGLPHWPYAGSVFFWSFADAVLMQHWAEMNTVLSLVTVFLAAVNPAIVWRCWDAMGCFERRASIAWLWAARDVSTAVWTRSCVAEMTQWIFCKEIQSKTQTYSTQQPGYLIKSSKYFSRRIWNASLLGSAAGGWGALLLAHRPHFGESRFFQATPQDSHCLKL